MLKLSVAHKIWSIVEHSFNGKHFKVAWYYYLGGDSRVRYICMQEDKTEFTIMTENELLHALKERDTIWFVLE